MNNINNIIEKLKTRKIKMRPRWYFAIKSVLLVVLIVLILLLILFLASFWLFYLRIAGIFFAPLPIILLLLMIVFMILVEFLINRYAVAYRKPVVYSLIIIITVIFAMSLVADKTRIHDKMEKRNIPAIKRIYNMPKREPMRRNIEIEINKRKRL